jgi:hypothetical protein
MRSSGIVRGGRGQDQVRASDGGAWVGGARTLRSAATLFVITAAAACHRAPTEVEPAQPEGSTAPLTAAFANGEQVSGRHDRWQA